MTRDLDHTDAVAEQDIRDQELADYERRLARTPVAEIQAAIDKLTELKAGRGYSEENGWLVEFVNECTCYGGGPTGHEPGCGYTPLTSDPLIVTLHRTIDPLLAVLRESLAWEKKVESYRQPSQSDQLMVALARSISGGN